MANFFDFRSQNYSTQIQRPIVNRDFDLTNHEIDFIPFSHRHNRSTNSNINNTRNSWSTDASNKKKKLRKVVYSKRKRKKTEIVLVNELNVNVANCDVYPDVETILSFHITSPYAHPVAQKTIRRPPRRHALFYIDCLPGNNIVMDTNLLNMWRNRERQIQEPKGPYRQVSPKDDGRSESILWRFFHYALHIPLNESLGWVSDHRCEYTSLHPHPVEGPKFCKAEWCCDNPSCARFDVYQKDEETLTYECSCGCNYMLCISCLNETQIYFEGNDLNYEKLLYRATNMGWYEIIETCTIKLTFDSKTYIREIEAGKTVHVIQQKGHKSHIDQPCCGWVDTDCLDFIDHCLYYVVVKDLIPVGQNDRLHRGDVVEVSAFCYDGQVQIVRPFKCYIPLDTLKRIQTDLVE